MSDIWVKTHVTASTINTAIASAQPGDHVIIPDGTYPSLGQIKIPSDIDGTEANPITLKAATPGGVTFTGNSASPLIFVQGDWWIIRDFKFIDVSEVGATNTYGIITRNANNVRITNNYFKRFGYNVTKQSWPIYIAHAGNSDGTRVDHNTFIDNEVMNIHVSAKSGAIGRNTQIDHNYFKNTFDDDSNAMMIGTGDSAYNEALNLHTIVEYNIFENMYGDEPVSNKSSSNTYRHNVFKESNGQHNRGLVLRMGDDCIVDGNYFLDVNRNSIRVHGTGHKIINNYFENPDYSAILLAEGSANYADVSDILIANNTIINPKYRGIHIGWWSTPGTSPNNLTFTNNILISDVTGSYLVRDSGHIGTFVWESNLHYATGGASYWHNDGGGNEPSIGITHATEQPPIPPLKIPVTENDVGANWSIAVVTCNNPTTHQPSGCALLKWSDTNGDGVINTTNTASGQLARGEITQEEFDFIEKAVNAGSINAICPGCYGAALAKGMIVGLTYPASVDHGAMCDINAAIKNIGELSGRFKTRILVDGTILVTSPEFTLAGGATSSDKIDPFKAPLTGESMDIIIKCLRSE